MKDIFLDCKDNSTFFCVPNILVDSYMFLITETDLKLALYILRNNGKKILINDVASTFKVTIEEIKNSYENLKKIGILKSDKETEKESVEINNTQCRNSVYETILKHKKPDPKFVVNRINNSEEIAFLMKEAQAILGRPISNLDSAALIMFHDTDGLPVDVILMILQYAVSVGKNNMRYIEKVAISWGSLGINTLMKAEEKIKELKSREKILNDVKTALNFEDKNLTKREAEYFVSWVTSLKVPLDLIKEGFRRCMEVKGKYIVSYIDAILKDWKNLKIDTLDKLKDFKNLRNKKSSKRTNPSSDAESYFSKIDQFA